MPDFLNALDRLRQAITNQPGAAANGDQMLNVNLSTLLAGEDTTVGVIKVEQRFGYTVMSLAAGAPTANNLKSGAGFLHAITFNAPQANEIVQLGDGTASGSGVFAGITVPSVNTPFTLIYDVVFANGLTVMAGSTTAAHNLTVSWR